MKTKISKSIRGRELRLEADWSSFWSNAPMGTKVAERDLDVAKLVEFSASQDGILHCDSNGEAIMYASDEAPKARITED